VLLIVAVALALIALFLAAATISEGAGALGVVLAGVAAGGCTATVDVIVQRARRGESILRRPRLTPPVAYGRPKLERREWRLSIPLVATHADFVIHALNARGRAPASVSRTKYSGARLPLTVRITHDRERLFAYAPDRPALDAARMAIEETIEDVIGKHDRIGDAQVSVWDPDLDRWREVEPPPSPTQAALDKIGHTIAANASTRLETCTLIAHAGRLVDAEVEQTMLALASRLGLDCAVVRRRRLLLSTRLEFCVTGTEAKLRKFRRELINTCRTVAAGRDNTFGPTGWGM
jgi:hypothetical protein